MSISWLSTLKTIDLIKKGKVEAFPDGQFVIDGVLYQETTEVEPSRMAVEAIANA